MHFHTQLKKNLKHLHTINHAITIGLLQTNHNIHPHKKLYMVCANSMFYVCTSMHINHLQIK